MILDGTAFHLTREGSMRRIRLAVLGCVAIVLVPRALAGPALPPSVTTATNTEACPIDHTRQIESQPRATPPAYAAPVPSGLVLLVDGSGYWLSASLPP